MSADDKRTGGFNAGTACVLDFDGAIIADNNAR
jgi:hypothetical protein